MYSSFGRTGGCASCGVAPRGISGDHYSNNYYSTFNRYEANNNYNDYYNLDNNRLNTSYSNGLRNRIMTPQKNYTKSYLNTNSNDNDYSYTKNNYRSYHSPQRNIGCRECAANSDQIRNRNNLRPFSGNYLMRSNNLDRYNIKKDLFKENYENNINNERYKNDEDNVNNNYKFNRYRSPDNNIRKNLYISKYDNIEMNNNRYYLNGLNNNTINSNINNNNNYSPNKLYNSTSFNEYKNYLNNKYNYNRNLIFKKRGDILLKQNENQLLSPIYQPRNIRRNYKYEIENERFIDLNQYNYQNKLKELLYKRKTFFVFIHGSNDYSGKSWCSDCNIAKPNIDQGKNLIKIKKDEKEVYFLSIPIEKIYTEDFRDDPYIQLERVPTLILFDNGVEKGRLIENDLFSYLRIREFIMQVYEPEEKGQYIHERRNFY